VASKGESRITDCGRLDRRTTAGRHRVVYPAIRVDATSTVDTLPRSPNKRAVLLCWCQYSVSPGWFQHVRQTVLHRQLLCRPLTGFAYVRARSHGSRKAGDSSHNSWDSGCSVGNRSCQFAPIRVGSGESTNSITVGRTAARQFVAQPVPAVGVQRARSSS
jgi:hypothetical protein